MRSILPRTLFGRLLLVFLAFGAAMTAALLVVMQVSHRTYHLQSDQTVNRRLAANYVASGMLSTAAPTRIGLQRELAKLAAANPDVDLYVLDATGTIIASSVPERAWRKPSIDLAPVRAFLDGARLPVLGDDPRAGERRDIFSAAPVSTAGLPGAFLYVVLHRQEHAAGATRLRTRYTVGEGAGVVILAAVLAVMMSLLVVRLLTRRLSALDDAMRRFELASGTQGSDVPSAGDAVGDEIDRLTAAFQRLATRIETQMQALQSTDAMRREVLANVSHDLRTPLATLQAHLEKLSLDGPGAGAARRDYVDVSLRQTQRLVRLVEQLLEAAKLDASQVQLELEPFALGDLLQDIVQKFALAARECGVELALTVPSGLPWVEGDVALIERVLDNLIENALRHSPPGSRIELEIARVGERIRCSVTDAGPGLTPSEVGRVFERFYRADPSRSGRTGHAGLGLAIVKSILELHGARIEVDGRPGRGARFWFEFPVSESRREALATDNRPRAAEARGVSAAPSAGRDAPEIISRHTGDS